MSFPGNAIIFHYYWCQSFKSILAQWRLISPESAVATANVFNYCRWIAWDILFVMSSVTGNLCNKCPKWLVKQNSSYSDYFNVISGFTSNSRAPGGPVTFDLGSLLLAGFSSKVHYWWECYQANFQHSTKEAHYTVLQGGQGVNEINA